jgi:hypothetical protein
MAYDYTKKKKVNKFRSIVLYVDGKAQIVGNLVFGGNKGYIRLKSGFLKEKGEMFLRVMNAQDI